MKIGGDELRARMASLPVDQLRAINGPSAYQYTPEAHAAAEEELARRTSREEEPAALPPRWVDQLPPRIRQMLLPSGFLAAGSTLLLLVVRTEVLLLASIAFIAWSLFLGILYERSWVRRAACMTAAGAALWLASAEIEQSTLAAALAGLLPLWWAWRLWRDPAVRRYTRRCAAFLDGGGEGIR
jgi:hypothetical protein